MLLHHFAEQGALLNSGDAPRNYVERSVHWQLDLDGDGRVLGLTPLGLQGTRGTTHLIPDPSRSSEVAAGLGSDIGEYVLGWQRVDRKTKERIANAKTPSRQRAFRRLMEDWAAQTEPERDPVPHIVAGFLQSGIVVEQPVDADGSQYVMLTVRLAGRTIPVHESASAAEFWAAEIKRRKGGISAQGSDNTREGFCLICSQQRPLAMTVPGSIPRGLLPGATSSISVASVNGAAFGYDGALQLAHAPLCFPCADDIVNGAVHVLSHNRISWPGQHSVTTWWVSDSAAEQVAAAIMGTLLEEGSDDPDDVSEVLGSARDGMERRRSIATAHFRAATLGAYISRLVVRDWIDISLSELLANVRSWMTDHRVNGRVFSLRRLAVSCGRYTDKRYAQMGSKSDDRLADLQDILLHAALLGLPVPGKVANRVLHRIWRDHHIDGPRLALLQLTRRGQPVLTLDAPDQPAAYVLGRLIALFDSVQARSSDGKINRTFAARTLSSARARPGLVLRDGIQLAESAWLPKIDRSKPVSAMALRRELAAVQVLITDDTALDRPLSPSGQVLLVLGLGHQRHRLFERADEARARARARAREADPNIDSDDTDNSGEQ
ncbi:type I-C CRISPR-associated protein Cas8c/Csd1 [Actinoalloteichus hymeniacidonis]|uniref:CRISPR-associated protein Csd1 n=1 Tax=Actinoalloteichus hymeniacidonis TaxID=340345 RepID=A0AAC9HQ26_9PSEU|nr:type I-C CRISPR-associated protein Cas8c/Csd1 [Actinoalloteichus hymeniacidonis]AOS63409.1 CRISPR-associated protein Csd1 [Actinoalloteichus hymeniacidonis]MBB5908550.1 CRISPR-associated protein Csd1 [Actinoalloteichus hymeniacidonis]